MLRSGFPAPFGSIRRRALMGVVFGALVLTGAAGCGSEEPTTAGGGGAEAPATKANAGPPTGFTAPDTIGSLSKSADQGKAQTALASLRKQADVKDAIVTQYQDGTDAKRVVTVSGLLKSAGEVPTESDLDKLMLYRVATDSPNKPIAVGTGTAGGLGKCINSSAGTIKSVECAWSSQRAMVFVKFENFEIGPASAQMPAILTATVKT
jgi:hypothetical protein